MCRHTCYIGSPVSLEEFLFQPDHGLLVQSYKPKEMIEAEINVDGFGLGWYPEDGTLRRYANTKPIWRIETYTSWLRCCAADCGSEM